MFGENFPYTNFHDMNMDWIIKIAKDFLDQYTHLQETIDQGLQDIQDKADELQGLLQNWYDTHSEDIANQLADALSALQDWYTDHVDLFDALYAQRVSQFDTHADQKAEQTIATIPSDYTALGNQALDSDYTEHNIFNLVNHGVYNPSLHWYQQMCSGDDGHVDTSANQIRCQIFYVGKGNFIRLTLSNGYKAHVRWYNTEFLTSFVSSTNDVSGLIEAPNDWLIVALTTGNYGNITPSASSNIAMTIYSLKSYPQQGLIYSMAYSADPATFVNVDLVNGTITFGNATSGAGRTYLRTGRYVYQIGTKTVSFSDEYTFIYYRVSTETMIAITAAANNVMELSSDYVYIGSIWGLHKAVNLNVLPFYFVNGAVTYRDDSRGSFDILRSYGYEDYNMAVLGDSTSTFEGVSEDEIGGRQVRGAYYPYSTLTSQTQMWWYKLRNMLRFGGALNVSAISRSCYLHDIDNQEMYAPAVWNSDRIDRLQLNNHTPHYIFIDAGINDGYSTNQYGEFSYENRELVIEEEPLSIARGIELTLRRVMNRNPYARVILIIPYAIKIGTTGYNWKSYYKLCELLEQIGKAYGVYRIVDLRKCGITEGNVNLYTFDGIHPNPDGMDFIASYIYNVLTNDEQAIRK